MPTSIKVENISKIYRLGQIGTGTISRDLQRWFTTSVLGKEDPFLKIGQTNDRTTKGESDVVYSLQDINFEIEQGDAVGIIGRNGAGKSTLLKILSRVTSPTTGRIQVKGRVASLLEVGTGFHPELTGRENIYLNGAILGMRKKEITRKLDEIIDFSGVERYIDTPVKRYSSGMYVRLAFAVAAHLESEILIVDEVLAVGDAEFQKKCLGKMGHVSKGDGRTVLFVSHNMAAVKTLCNKAIILQNGQMIYNGDTNTAISKYLKNGEEGQNSRKFDYIKKEYFELHAIETFNANSTNKAIIDENLEITLQTEITIKGNMPNGERITHITYHIKNELGEDLFSFSNEDCELKQGFNKLRCTFPSKFFQSGTFFLSLFIIANNSRAIFVQKDIFDFTVIDGGRELGSYMGREPGSIRPKFKWENT
jgi:lipopolysaccharide transport system ATP-binding protein